MKFNLPIAIVGSPSAKNFSQNISALESELRQLGHPVLKLRPQELPSQQMSEICAYICLAHNQPQLEAALEFNKFVRSRNDKVPVFLALGQSDLQVPQEAETAFSAFFYSDEDTAQFAAKKVCAEIGDYMNQLTPPFFKALLQYAESGSQSWHCPGHSGGAAFLKSPQGLLFHRYFGENMLRADVCNAVEELGQLLEHTGPVAEAEKNAARIFGADHLYFVTNGTSTSNKIVWQSLVSRDDIVIVDRNCHKSVLHAIILTGAIPIFLHPTRNHYGLIGPIPASEFTMESIQEKINANPFIKDKSKKPRLLTITQSTYDGILYNVERIKEMLDGKIEALHFDEAWLPHAAFHPIYDQMHAIDKKKPRTKEAALYVTQSTHKTLAGLSQASQILIQESEAKKLNRAVFNEAYLMHTSTSPQYSIIASCDVAAAMMEGRGGHTLVQDSLNEAAQFRRQMRECGKSSPDWWFGLWGPEPSNEHEQEGWVLKPEEDWHGFGNVEAGFNMLDPTKVTCLTPGLDRDGSFQVTGIPASITARFLQESGVIVEKCGLYSFFIMFTIGVTKGRWRTLISALQQFKKYYDANEPVHHAMPQFARTCPQYSNIGLRDLCQNIHAFYKQHDIAKTTTQMYLAPTEAALAPSESFAKTAHEETDRIAIENLEGRMTAVLLTPYPPGIPLLLPGERFSREIVNYLKFAAEFNNEFPGLETDVHGLVSETVDRKKSYFVDCLREQGKIRHKATHPLRQQTVRLLNRRSS